MSLYFCIDLIEDELKSFSTNNFNTAEKELLIRLKTWFESWEKEDKFTELKLAQDAIKQFKDKQKYTPRYLQKIEEDLVRMIEIFEDPKLKEENLYPIPEKKAWAGKYDYRIGVSKGECFGFTYAMADPELNPFTKNNNDRLKFNRKIYNYQRSQGRANAIISLQRLSHYQYAPSIVQQAEKLYEIAQQHKDKHLAISLRGDSTLHRMGHSVYLSVRSNGDIHYMNINTAACKYSSKADFIRWYALDSLPYLFFSVSEIQYAQEANSEKKSWSGKWRSALTGTKYSEPKDLLCYFSLKSALVLLITLPPMLIFHPLIIPALVGLCLYSLLDLYANFHGISGLLAAPYALITLKHALSGLFLNKFNPDYERKQMYSELRQKGYTPQQDGGINSSIFSTPPNTPEPAASTTVTSLNAS